MLNRATLIRPSHVSRIAASPVISKTAAPMALALAGVLGRGAERVRDVRPTLAATIAGLPARRTLAAITAAGLAGTVGEASPFSGRLS
jgi:hypothetical protein